MGECVNVVYACLVLKLWSWSYVKGFNWHLDCVDELMTMNYEVDSLPLILITK